MACVLIPFNYGSSATITSNRITAQTSEEYALRKSRRWIRLTVQTRDPCGIRIFRPSKSSREVPALPHTRACTVLLGYRDRLARQACYALNNGGGKRLRGGLKGDVCALGGSDGVPGAKSQLCDKVKMPTLGPMQLVSGSPETDRKRESCTKC